jgi:hypothetical protein
VFTPRFTLTGLRLPADELKPAAAAELGACRRDPATIELLVPPKDTARQQIDRRLDAYGGLRRRDDPGDAGRAAGLLTLVAARDRSLAEEIAKVENGLARHLLRVQVIVLRYVKALLLFLATALAVFAAAGVVSADAEVTPTSELWLATVYLLWAPMVVVAVGAPVRVIEGLLRAEGATRSALGADVELTRVERASVVLATIGWLTAAAAFVVSAVEHRPEGRVMALAVLGGGTGLVAMAVSFGSWAHRIGQRQLPG